MSVVLTPPAPTLTAAPRVPGLLFATGFVGIAILAAALAGAIPIEFSIATVFLFAGPHNWFEARYALGRLPARAGKLFGFFTVSAVGIIALTVVYAAIPFLYPYISNPAHVGALFAVWCTTLVFWVATLVWMRSRTNPRFDGGWVWPLACLISAAAWVSPLALPVALVYLHPLMALWLLDRELARSRPQWRRTYWCALACVPKRSGSASSRGRCCWARTWSCVR